MRNSDPAAGNGTAAPRDAGDFALAGAKPEIDKPGASMSSTITGCDHAAEIALS
jgi:hypothetical protein